MTWVLPYAIIYGNLQEVEHAMSDFLEYLDEAFQSVDVRDLCDGNPVQSYDIFDEISELVLSTRESLGITQKELAERTGLTQANISKIECGACRPTISTLQKIADGFGMRLTVDLVDITEEP